MNRYKPGTIYKWKRIRKRILKSHPLCKHCLAEGKIELATEVDHIKRVVTATGKIDTVRFFSLSNMQPLCRTHHNIKTHSSVGDDYIDRNREKLGIQRFSI